MPVRKNMSHQRGLLVRFNSRSGCIELYSADTTSEGVTPEFPKPYITIELGKLVTMSPEEAERRLGALVLTFLDFYSGSRMQIRDYQKIGREFSPSAVELAGPGEADFEVAMRHIDSCLASRSAQDLDAAESYLIAAVSAGSADAKRFFESEWPRTKALALRRIADEG